MVFAFHCVTSEERATTIEWKGENNNTIHSILLPPPLSQSEFVSEKFEEDFFLSAFSRRFQKRRKRKMGKSAFLPGSLLPFSPWQQKDSFLLKAVQDMSWEILCWEIITSFIAQRSRGKKEVVKKISVICSKYFNVPEWVCREDYEINATAIFRAANHKWSGLRFNELDINPCSKSESSQQNVDPADNIA